MTNYCKNHVGREAKRRCFLCQDYICPECQFRFYGHVFCSFYCAMKYLPFQLKRQLKSWYKNFLRNISINWTLVLLALLAVSLLGNILQFILPKKKEIVFIHPKQVIFPVNSSAPDSNRIQITAPKTGTLLHQNQTKIMGTGPEGRLVVMEQNGMPGGICRINKGCFEFEVTDLVVGTNQFRLTIISPTGTMFQDSLAVEYISSRISDLSRDFIRGKTQYAQVALTFDGDFLDNQADSILAILARHHKPATFFLTGRFILKYPKLVRKLIQAKLVVGNHTRHHPHLTTYAENGKHFTRSEITREKLQTELIETEKIFERVTGQKMERIWRAPFGEHNHEIRQWAAKIGYRQFGWTSDYNNHQSLDTVDWVADPDAENYYSAAQILERLVRFADTTPHGMNGGIILMHLGSKRKQNQSYQMLGALIDSLDHRGYQLVTVTEMVF